MKNYTPPRISESNPTPGLPTVLAVGAVSALAGAAAVGVSKIIGDDKISRKNFSISSIKD